MKKEWQEKIQKKIRSFELCALIRLLQSMGFRQNDIYFESHFSHVSPPSICEKISFSKQNPRVRITLNMGLLSTHSPIPSYFIKAIEKEEINGDQFLRFLGYFNHHLIHDFLRLTLPEKNSTLFTNWKETSRYYLSLLGFESISTLYLIFSSCFPELVIKIKKNTRTIRLRSSTLVLGRDGIGGEATIGERLEETLSSFQITLKTEEEISEKGTPWPIEINQRLYGWIYPILKKTDLHLSIILTVKNKYSSLHLGVQHYLGFDRIGKSTHPLELLLFHGFIKNLKINSYLAKSS